MVTLAGKYSGPYFEKIKNLKKELTEKGIDVLYPPEGDMSSDSFGFFESDERTGNDPKDFWKAEKNFIRRTYLYCDAIIICNYDGYLGGMTTNEFYYFTSLIASNYGQKNQASYYDLFSGYIPIYLLEDVNIESLSTPGEIGDFGSLLEYGFETGLIKVGLDSFYEDCTSGQITKMKKRR